MPCTIGNVPLFLTSIRSLLTPHPTHDRSEHPGAGAGELIDVAREMREVGALAAHQFGHRCLCPLRQLDLSRHADGVEKNFLSSLH